MHSTLLASMQHWTFTIRTQLGYPSFKPAADTLAFSAGGRKDFTEALQLTELAAEMNKDGHPQ